MTSLSETSKDPYDRFSTDSVPFRPYDRQSKSVAQCYIEQLLSLFNDADLEVLHRGSTALEIAGKGDIEIGVYPVTDAWSEVLDSLERHCGKAGKVEENYARFNDTLAGCEIEVIVLKGHDARVDKWLITYLREHAELLQEYERLKRRYCFSRREYQRQKDRFFARVIAAMPDLGDS